MPFLKLQSRSVVWRLWGVEAALLASVVVGACGAFGTEIQGSVARAVLIYFFLLLLFRLLGHRSLGEATRFDLVLILIISEAANPGLHASDTTVESSIFSILTLCSLDLTLSLLKFHFPTLERWIEGERAVLFEDGRYNKAEMAAERVSDDEIMEACRSTRGIDDLKRVKRAVLETNGRISVIPND